MEVTGNYRPGRPPLAVVVSGVLLLLTLVGAGALSHARNRPIALAAVRPVAGVPGLRMAWPADWSVLPRFGTGPIISGAAYGTGDRPTDKVLFLLADRFANRYVPPQVAASRMLEAAGQQLGLRPASREFVSATGEMLGRPAFQVKYIVHFRQRIYWALLRVAPEPDGRVIGLLLLTREPTSPAAQKVVDEVADSMELDRKGVDLSAALEALRLRSRSSDDPLLADLRGYVQALPCGGAAAVSLVPQGHGPAQAYAIELWTSWLANRRSLQDLAGTRYRRMHLRLDPPSEGDWVQRPGGRIWKMALTESDGDEDALCEALYLRELPGKRVVWAHSVATAKSDPEDIVVALLGAVEGNELSEWDYDQAVADGSRTLAAIATRPVNQYYRANRGRQDLTFRTADGHVDGAGRFVTSVSADGVLTRHEQVNLGPNGSILKSEKTSLLRPDLSGFHLKDLTDLGNGISLLVEAGRPDAGAPVNISMRFGRAAPIQASFLTREPFLPDPAIEAAAWHMAGRPGAAALFRAAGFDPEVPESVLLNGLGHQTVEVAGLTMDALVCVAQEDTAEPRLILFEPEGGLIGYVFASGASLLQAQPTSSQGRPASEPAQTEPATGGD